MKKGRVIWIVLDGVGIGALPDAADYGDADAATLPHVAAACGGLSLPFLQQLGLGNLAEIPGVPPAKDARGAYGRMVEISSGKDSIVGHWELAGVVVDAPFATYPKGFPAELVERFAQIAGKPPLGNVPASGVSILKEFGAEHLQTGRPILYTSVDSVFQVAVHEEVMPPEQLYELCRSAKSLADEYNIARVIARPFTGSPQEGFRRTPRRKDFPTPPPRPTLLEVLVAAGYQVATVGKIHDLFAERGISSHIASVDNIDGMEKTLTELTKLKDGLLMVNLIDFDMVYGHRKDAIGFGRALEAFDAWLPQLCAAMEDEDLLLITADHGCDPTTPGTDHTREYVPVIAWSKKMGQGIPLGTRDTFADAAATLAEFYGVSTGLAGTSFLADLSLEA